jgi:hypothetical protein
MSTTDVPPPVTGVKPRGTERGRVRTLLVVGLPVLLVAATIIAIVGYVGLHPAETHGSSACPRDLTFFQVRAPANDQTAVSFTSHSVPVTGDAALQASQAGFDPSANATARCIADVLVVVSASVAYRGRSVANQGAWLVVYQGFGGTMHGCAGCVNGTPGARPLRLCRCELRRSVFRRERRGIVTSQAVRARA